MKSKPYRERRKYMRADLTGSVFCAVPNIIKWVDVCYMHARNISRQGMCLIAESFVSVGKDIYLQFKLSRNSAPLTVLGKVIWSTHDDARTVMGVRFIDLNENFGEMVYHYVLKNYDLSSPSQF